MHQTMSLKPEGVDGEILDALLEGRYEDQPWGRNTPSNLAEELGYSRQHMSNRLQMLEVANAVENIGGGVYEFIRDPREDKS